MEKLDAKTLMQLQAALTPRLSKYIPHIPTAKQSAFLLLNCREAFYGGSAGGGKALLLETPVLTQEGWKTIGSLKLTDKVVALDGTWANIEYITEVQPNHECYNIIFNNGESIVADGEHLWITSQYRNRKYWQSVVVSTKELKVGDKLIRSEPLVGNHKNLLVHPYVLGCWLGDGSAHGSMITLCDEDILTHIKTLGYNIKPVASMSISYYIQDIHGLLNKLGVLRDKHENRETQPETKHIPEEYFLSSFEQRLELLRGIMDTGGSCRLSGRCEIGLKEKRLTDDVCTLLASLGITFSRNIAPTRYKNKLCSSFRITFSTNLRVFNLARKSIRQRRSCDDRIIIKDIIPYGCGSVKCIKIKHPSHTFLVGKTLIPTHNSDALLMAALQYVDVPGYAAILFRRTYSDLTLPEALLDRTREWLTPWKDAGEVRWSEKEKTYFFSTGSTLSFGYLEHPTDKFRYQGAAFQFIGFDELTQIDENSYRYLFSRLRRQLDVQVPLRMRGASNPGGSGHEWVKRRFITEGLRKGRVFIPANVNDNPYLDIEQYKESLAELDPVTRAQLLEGNWEVRHGGLMFQRTWFGIVRQPPTGLRKVRYWDLAASAAEGSKSKDPDWTVGLLLGEKSGNYWVLDVIRVKRKPHEVEMLVKQTAALDGWTVPIFMEQEPGSAGLGVIDHYQRNVLGGYAFRPSKYTGSKVIKANPVSAAAQAGRIKIVEGYWNSAFLDELDVFPADGAHDDQADALAGAYLELKSAINFTSAPIEVGENECSYWKQLDEARAV